MRSAREFFGGGAMVSNGFYSYPGNQVELHTRSCFFFNALTVNGGSPFTNR